MLTLALCADPGILGRFDKSSLSDQDLMELLVGDLTDVAIAKDSNDNFTDIKKWSILDFDRYNRVRSIEMNNAAFDINMGFFDDDDDDWSIERICFNEGGSIDLQYVPSTVTLVRIDHMFLKGTIATRDLPRELKTLDLQSNKFFGMFETADLPPTLEVIYISHNAMEGSVHLEHLPNALMHFGAHSNAFTGSLRLSQLPEHLVSLNLANNGFEGQITLINIPKTLHHAELHENLLSVEKATVEHPNRLHMLLLDAALHERVFGQDGAKYAGNEIVFKGLCK